MLPLLLASVFAPRLDADGFPLPAEAVCRIGSARFRHDADVILAHYTPDGRTLVTGTLTELAVWDADTGRRRQLIPLADRGDQRRTDWLGVSADGTEVRHLSAGIEAVVTGFDLRTGRANWRTPLPVCGTAALGPDGERAAVWDAGEVLVFESRTGRPVGRCRFHRADGPNRLALSADGRPVAAVWYGNAVEAVDTATGAVRFFAARPTGGRIFPLLALSADGRRLVWGVRDDGRTEVRVTDLSGAGDTVRLPLPATGDLHTAALSADGRRVAVLQDVGDSIRLKRGTVWSLPDGRRTCELPEHAGSRLALSPDGRTVVYEIDNGLWLHDADTGERRPQSADPKCGRLTAVAGGRLAAATQEGTTVYDATTGRLLRRWPVRAVVSPDGTRVVVPAADRFTMLEAATGRTLWAADLRSAYQTWFADGGRVVFTAGRGRPVRGFDAATGRPVPTAGPSAAEWVVSPDGRAAVGLWVDESDAGRVEVWDARFTAARGGWGFRHGWNPALSPGGRLLALPGEMANAPVRRPLTVIDTHTGRVRRGFEGASPHSPAFSPDGRTLAISTREVVELWEVAGGQRRHTFRHRSGVLDVVFVADGRTLAAASADAPGYVWDVSGQTLGSPGRMDRAALEADWQVLAGNDASAAFATVRRLAAAQADAVPFLADKLQPVDSEKVTGWLKELDSPRYPDREAADRRLRAVAHRIEPRLRAVLATHPSPEVRSRLTAILDALDVPTPEGRRFARAMEALGWMGTPAAGEVLRRFTPECPTNDQFTPMPHQ